MKIFFIILSVFYSVLSQAQLIDGIKFQMGPKMDFYSSEQHAVVMQAHMDFSAGLFAFKKLDQNWEIQIGIIKNDYSARFKVVIDDVNTGREETYFKKFVYPTYSSYQLALMPNYQFMYTNKIAFYGSVGLLLYLKKELSREGTEERTEDLVDEDLNKISELTLTTYNNSLLSGNYLLRADIGMLIGIKDYLAIDIGLNARMSTLDHNGFRLNYQDQFGSNYAEDYISNKAIGLGLNIGMKFNLN